MGSEAPASIDRAAAEPVERICVVSPVGAVPVVAGPAAPE
jgi:hypothetical protein